MTKVAAPTRRRALTNVGGPTTTSGDPDLAAVLGAALDVAQSTRDADAEDAARAHVHGFHSYPARMHPETARRLVAGLSSPGATVLDPFCGSGTVVVEARLAGRRAIGVDLNPLAVRLTELKARGVGETARLVLLEAARAAASVAEERRTAKSGPTHRYGHDDLEAFDRHVLLELDGLRLGIDKTPDARVRGDLELVFSSILTKLGRRASDTQEGAQPRRIAAGYATRLLVKKTEELCRRLAEIEPALSAAPAARVIEADARDVGGKVGRASSIDLVVTSPPYPGVYDYLAHHATRLRWLRLPGDRLEAAEIGARRRLDPRTAPARGQRPAAPDAPLLRWRDELAAVLAALARVMRPTGRAAILLSDGIVAGAPSYADDLLRELAPRAGLAIVATTSQERQHFHGPTSRAFRDRPRREHAFLLSRP